MLQSKRQCFAREFLVDRNATKAAERAGYSVRTAKQQGSRLLTFVDVQSEIAALEIAQVEVDQVNREFVIKGLRELALNAKTESNKVRSYELLGKTLRMFVEVSESIVIHDSPVLREFTQVQLELMLTSIQRQVASEGEVRVLDS
ncbi:MAG: terminase small subunit [Chloroflexi bacterium]|nr:terminase small subunit [Chloroflexota bacterium]